MSIVLETTIGDLTIDLFVDECPLPCLNFLKLCKMKYYNFNLFHTVQHNFLAQTGDPTGEGTGGESIWGVLDKNKRYFEQKELKLKHNNAGTVSLVSTGDNLFGSQFFITLASNLTSLNGKHCVIGEVVEGLEVLLKFQDAICDEEFRPYQDIRITHTVILDDPFPDPKGFCEPSKSPERTTERLQNGRIGADEAIDDTAGKTHEEIAEMMADREAKARATLLEMIGDLPDAEIAPPENVLFVCQLNPVTNEDDLEIIFSRFGNIKSCEVIRDKKTGDSLQYAFVEFDNKKSCEDAYFKMDNVLIDDRRIHVDFSQSVSKIKWFGKGRYIRNDEENGDERRKHFKKSRSRSLSKNVRKKFKRSYSRENADYLRDRHSNKFNDYRRRDSNYYKEKKSSRSRSIGKVKRNNDQKSDTKRYRSRSKSKRSRSVDNNRGRNVSNIKSKRRSNSRSIRRSNSRNKRNRSLDKKTQYRSGSVERKSLVKKSEHRRSRTPKKEISDKNSKRKNTSSSKKKNSKRSPSDKTPENSKVKKQKKKRKKSVTSSSSDSSSSSSESSDENAKIKKRKKKKTVASSSSSSSSTDSSDENAKIKKRKKKKKVASSSSSSLTDSSDENAKIKKRKKKKKVASSSSSSSSTDSSDKKSRKKLKKSHKKKKKNK